MLALANDADPAGGLLLRREVPLYRWVLLRPEPRKPGPAHPSVAPLR